MYLLIKLTLQYSIMKNYSVFILKYFQVIFHPSLRIVNVAVYPNAKDETFGQTVAIAGGTGFLSVTNMFTKEAIFQYEPKQKVWIKLFS